MESIHEAYIHNNPIPKRSYKKSVNGCQACKKRKIKCDEKRPVCSRCALHFSNIKSCEYAPAPKPNKKVASTTRRPRTAPPLRAEYTSSSLNITCFDNEPQEVSSLPALDGQERDTKLKPLLHNAMVDVTELKPDCCGCPCHVPAFTSMLLDDFFGICRICGNLPRLSKSASHCVPLVSDATLKSGRVDPFSVLPINSSPRVYALMYHWANTLSDFPTEIYSQYCTNPTWLSRALSHPVLFHATLYVCSVHDAGLRGHRETSESLYFKTQTIRLLNQFLRDPISALTDEVLSSILLLTHVVSIIGEPEEVEAHLKGLQQLIELRGGVQSFTIGGVFLHMLCTTNHLTAVLSESQNLVPPNGRPYKPFKTECSGSAPVHKSPLMKPFAVSIGFHPTVVDLLHDMEYLYPVVDAFTTRFLHEFRPPFNRLVKHIEDLQIVGPQQELDWNVGPRLERHHD